MTDPFGVDAGELLPGEPTDAMRVMSMDGTVQHIPDPGPADPFLLWEGEVTPKVQAFLRRGNVPWWVEGTALVVATTTDDEDEDNTRVYPGEWITYLGDGHGYEAGRVHPVFMRTGWDMSEVRVGYILTPEDMPGLLRAMADAWLSVEGRKFLPPGYELAFNVTDLREGK